MTYFTRTAYCRSLVTNYESVEKTTNQYFKSSHSPSVVDEEADFFLVKHHFEYTLVSLRSQQLIKI